MLSTIESSNLALRFLLEVGALAILGAWGLRAGGSLPARIALGAGLPVLAAVAWATFGAPGAPVAVPAVARVALEALIFGAAAVCLVALNRSAAAGLFAAAALANAALMHAWGQ